MSPLFQRSFLCEMPAVIFQCGTNKKIKKCLIFRQPFLLGYQFPSLPRRFLVTFGAFWQIALAFCWTQSGLATN